MHLLSYHVGIKSKPLDFVFKNCVKHIPAEVGMLSLCAINSAPSADHVERESLEVDGE